MSQSCLASQSVCSKCGHVSYELDDFCDHLKNECLSEFNGSDGKVYIVANVLGDLKNPKGSIHFIEVSLVRQPAFFLAIFQKIFNLSEVRSYINSKSAYHNFSSWKEDMLIDAGRAYPKYGDFLSALSSVNPELLADTAVSLNIFHSSMQGGALMPKKIFVPRLGQMRASMKAKSYTDSREDILSEADALTQDLLDLPDEILERIFTRLEEKKSEIDAQNETTDQAPPAGDQAPPAGDQAPPAGDSFKDNAAGEEEVFEEASFVELPQKVLSSWIKLLTGSAPVKASADGMVKIPANKFMSYIRFTRSSEDGSVTRIPRKVLASWVSELEQSVHVPKKQFASWVSELEQSVHVPKKQYASWMERLSSSAHATLS